MKLEKPEHLKWIKTVLIFLVFYSSRVKAWDGYDENTLNKVYINPSEKIRVGNPINFIEKSYIGTQKKKMVVERTSSSYGRHIDKIYGYVDGDFVVFCHLHD